MERLRSGLKGREDSLGQQGATIQAMQRRSLASSTLGPQVPATTSRVSPSVTPPLLPCSAPGAYRGAWNVRKRGRAGWGSREEDRPQR